MAMRKSNFHLSAEKTGSYLKDYPENATAIPNILKDFEQGNLAHSR